MPRGRTVRRNVHRLFLLPPGPLQLDLQSESRGRQLPQDLPGLSLDRGVAAGREHRPLEDPVPLDRRPPVEVVFSSEVTEILPAAVRLRTPGGSLEIGDDYVFILAGGEPPVGLLNKIGVRFGGGPAAP